MAAAAAERSETNGANSVHDSVLVETQALTRTFRKNIAVNRVDLQVQQGETFGIIGPDGAGKTTLLRLLAGLLSITSGKASVHGFDLARTSEHVKRVIGYMAQDFSLYAELSVMENLLFFAELYDVPDRDRDQRIARLLHFSRLEPFQERRAAHLSGGMQKKLSLACTLIHQPPLLILDEPTTGVDPVSRREFWDLLTELHIQGTTILLSTPYMDEAERCQRVGLMYQGRMVKCDTPNAIRSTIPGELLEIQCTDWRKARKLLADLPGIYEIQSYGDLLRVFVDSGERRSKEIARALRVGGIAEHTIRPSVPHMEEAFISIIRGMED